ncbi:MAG: S8 family serine peptidase [Akkermansiaceae bacterium]|nr:S8 family serine peptidase [Akkermansiaceae bacterium]NNM30551.1 S8 family serine peptidase [Akkermansiaceae bacterium]
MWPDLDAIRSACRSGTGRGVRVAILDTGIDEQHPRLSGAGFLQAQAVQAAPNGFRVGECAPEDAFGHGTAVAGIIHALAPETEMQSICVLDCKKRQHRHEVVKLGALYAIEEGATILNCSFGIPGAAFTLPVYKAWTDHAFERDRHVVAASSNADPDESHWPASLAQVLAVTGDHLAPEELRFRHGSLISFAAAGVDIPVLAPSGSSAVLTGSSFAAAHLTGLLARLLSVFPGLTPMFAHAALRRLAEENGHDGKPA